MTELATTVDTYLEGYGEADPIRCNELVVRAFTDDAALIDPPLVGREHHGFARYGWQLLTPDDTVALTGMDIVQVAPDGRLTQVVGFFGDLAAAPTP